MGQISEVRSAAVGMARNTRAVVDIDGAPLYLEDKSVSRWGAWLPEVRPNYPIEFGYMSKTYRSAAASLLGVYCPTVHAAATFGIGLH